MAVQIPDPGTGNGQTGDNEYVFRKKVKDNFSDQSNAASRLLGSTTGRVPLAEETFKSAHATGFIEYAGNVNDLESGSKAFTAKPHTNTPDDSLLNWVIYTIPSHSSSTYLNIIKRQLAFGYGNIQNDDIYTRSKRQSGEWSAWRLIGQSPATYTATTAAGANTVVDINGKLMRSTSSERYKDILAPLELDDARYQDAMALKPIVYRSTADADNPAYHYYSFSAEELGAYDPAFTLWRETETVTDEDGNVTEQPLSERQAEGININALLAMSHAIAIKQDKIIKALEHRLDILEAK